MYHMNDAIGFAKEEENVGKRFIHQHVDNSRWISMWTIGAAKIFRYFTLWGQSITAKIVTNALMGDKNCHPMGSFSYCGFSIDYEGIGKGRPGRGNLVRGKTATIKSIRDFVQTLFNRFVRYSLFRGRSNTSPLWRCESRMEVWVACHPIAFKLPRPFWHSFDENYWEKKFFNKIFN